VKKWGKNKKWRSLECTAVFIKFGHERINEHDFNTITYWEISEKTFKEMIT
jgi:hypothetical protein